jgi:hypothetical protein
MSAKIFPISWSDILFNEIYKLKNKKHMQKNIIKIVLVSLLSLPLIMALPVGATVLPNWNVVGTYQLILSGTYSHDIVITTQNPDGSFSGTGGYPSGGSPYTADGQTAETIMGQVTGDAITFTMTYTGPFSPGTVANFTGTIASDGTMSGNSPDEWHTTLGNATVFPQSSGSGQIGGNVTLNNGVLKIDSITLTKSTSTADGTFDGGWKYVFHITAPNSESKLVMNFSNWLNTVGATTIPVANNMRISSAQADNAGATILLTGANTYSTPILNMVNDLDPAVSGRQVDVTVEVSIPVGTTSGAYTTNYGVQTNP